jgi:hypothetical protein
MCCHHRARATVVRTKNGIALTSNSRRRSLDTLVVQRNDAKFRSPYRGLVPSTAVAAEEQGGVV